MSLQSRIVSPGPGDRTARGDEGLTLDALDDESIELRAGMTLRIPAGVRHNLTNTGTEPLTCLIAFSSGDRQTVFLE